jgi:hypothetical protein
MQHRQAHSAKDQPDTTCGYRAGKCRRCVLERKRQWGLIHIRSVNQSHASHDVSPSSSGRGQTRVDAGLRLSRAEKKSIASKGHAVRCAMRGPAHPCSLQRRPEALALTKQLWAASADVSTHLPVPFLHRDMDAATTWRHALPECFHGSLSCIESSAYLWTLLDSPDV